MDNQPTEDDLITALAFAAAQWAKAQTDDETTLAELRAAKNRLIGAVEEWAAAVRVRVKGPHD